MSYTKIYRLWHYMITRCHTPSSSAYKDYGAKGITVCETWKNSFIQFYVWALSQGYKDGLEIDRINNNLGYSPDNCRWVTRNEQMRNRKNSVMIRYGIKTQCLAAWIEEYGISRGSFRWKIRQGKSKEVALSECIAAVCGRKE